MSDGALGGDAWDEAPTKGGAGSGNAMVDRYNSAALTNFNDNVLEKCQNCGRTFAPDRLVIHQRSCTAANAFKAPLKRGAGLGGHAPSVQQVGLDIAEKRGQLPGAAARSRALDNKQLDLDSSPGYANSASTSPSA